MRQKNSRDIVVIGIGSSVLSDGAAPVQAVQLLRELMPKSNAEFKVQPAGGFDLLYELTEFRKAIIIDCQKNDSGNPGDIVRKSIYYNNYSCDQIVLSGAHGSDLSMVLQLGRKCGYVLPGQIVIFEICGQVVTTLGELLTPKVEQAQQQVAKMVEQQIIEWDT